VPLVEVPQHNAVVVVASYRVSPVVRERTRVVARCGFDSSVDPVWTYR
jgi:hypothetical protein